MRSDPETWQAAVRSSQGDFAWTADPHCRNHWTSVAADGACCSQPVSAPGRQTSAVQDTPVDPGRKAPERGLHGFSDDHRYDAMGSAGTPIVKTPNMDRSPSQACICATRLSRRSWFCRAGRRSSPVSTHTSTTLWTITTGARRHDLLSLNTCRRLLPDGIRRRAAYGRRWRGHSLALTIG